MLVVVTLVLLQAAASQADPDSLPGPKGRVSADCMVGENGQLLNCLVEPLQGQASPELLKKGALDFLSGLKIPLDTAPDHLKIGDHWRRSLSVDYPGIQFPKSHEVVVTFNCDVGANGSPQACRVLKQEPPGFDFTDAALSLAKTMHFKATGTSYQWTQKVRFKLTD